MEKKVGVQKLSKKWKKKWEKKWKKKVEKKVRLKKKGGDKKISHQKVEKLSTVVVY